MSVKKFDNTTWNVWHPERHPEDGWNKPGWEMPSDHGRYIGSSDSGYWDHVLDSARSTYGDPNIRYNTENPDRQRYLVFGDGTRLPTDGTVVYHDATTKQNWIQHDDGTVQAAGPDGHPQPGVPQQPAGYRRAADGKVAPIDERGHQISPLRNDVPTDKGQSYYDNNGVLTPTNSKGDYYTLGPDGKRSFFDKSGAPITAEQYERGSGAEPPAQNTSGVSDTDEQQTGQGAAALKKLHSELAGQYNKISDADQKFSDVLMNAHAATTAGRDRLNAIQKDIVDAVNNPAVSLDAPAGQRSFLTMLKAHAAEVNDLLASGGVNSEDSSKIAQAIAGLYAADAADGSDPNQPQQPAGPSAPASPLPAEPAPSDPGGVDPGLGPAPQMPDPDPGLGLVTGAPGEDPYSSLMSALPGLLSGLGGAASSPLDGLSSLGGLGSGLGDLGGDHDGSSEHDDPWEKDDPEPKKDSPPSGADPSQPGAPAPGQQQPNQPGAPAPEPGAPPPPLANPAANLTVTLPDGSSGTTRSPQASAAMRDVFAGTPLDTAFRQNNLQLPPPGTPITDPVDNNKLMCGDIAMFKDHYEPVLSIVKGYLNGQVVPLSSVISSPDFMGFFDPTAAATAAAPAGPAPSVATTPPAAPLAAAPPPPAAAAPAPVGG